MNCKEPFWSFFSYFMVPKWVGWRLSNLHFFFFFFLYISTASGSHTASATLQKPHQRCPYPHLMQKADLLILALPLPHCKENLTSWSSPKTKMVILIYNWSLYLGVMALKLKEGRFRLGIKMMYFTMKVVKNQHRLPRGVMNTPSLQVLKVRLDWVLSNLV